MDNTQVKIAFHGKMGTGKDTSVDYLIRKHGGVKISFSEPLYNILHYAQEICGFEKKKDRKFLQFIGTEWGRNIQDNIWVDLAIKKSQKETTKNVYNSDCRFFNELEALKKTGFLCVKIKRTNIVKSRLGSGYINHESEKGLDDCLFDFVIENNGTLLELYKKIDEIFNLIKK